MHIHGCPRGDSEPICKTQVSEFLTSSLGHLMQLTTSKKICSGDSGVHSATVMRATDRGAYKRTLPVLETGSLKPGCQHGWVGAVLWLQTFLCILTL